jgi:septal ring factor EnvC (AmiA/AmiB activator)
MTKDEITAKIDDIQAALNQVSQQLLSQSPQAQNLIGQLQAYNQMLSEPEPETKPVGKK